MQNKAFQVAKLIQNHWQSLIKDYLELTALGKPYFEQRRFNELFEKAQIRYRLSGGRVKIAVDEIKIILGDDILNHTIWQEIKNEYISLNSNRNDIQNTETFYNSVTRKIFNTIQHAFDENFEFFDDKDYLISEFTEPLVYASITSNKLSLKLIKDILLSFGFDVPWINIDRDVKNIFDEIAPTIIAQKNNLFLDKVEMLNTVFYRNRGAFLVGRLKYLNWTMPIVIPILNEEQGLFVDTVIFNTADISIIFSFTRASFFAYTEKPKELINFLKIMLPQKPLAELYDSIGYYRHGKTILYRNLYNYIRNHDDKFIIAPGIKGMVMCVFTLQYFNFVFKIVKDRFENPKTISREGVFKKYEEVEINDRVGRMAYAHSFEHLVFPKKLFTDELLEELKLVAKDTVIFDGENLIFRHCYLERKMIPLNIYLEKASPIDRYRAALDYGYCVKELAAANIFPGDLLHKNFGVTRHGRVIFYDYDEICKITECKFKRLPDPSDDDLYSGKDISISADTHDIFPQEFRNFMAPSGDMGEVFLSAHEDLFDPKFWRNIQKSINSGEYLRFYAYDESKRFSQL
jgi:isocitrate dehydrogenase kinase/phosphatase